MRLDVTRKSDLAVRVLQILGRDHGNRMKGPQLAEAVGSTAAYIPQVLTPLVRAGWVRSEPGPTGGYSLSTSSGDITVLEVIEAVEGPTDTGRCVLGAGMCDDGDTCALHVAWTRARTELLRELGAVTVAEAQVTPTTG